MKTIYHLRNDSQTVAHMQRISQEPGPRGLQITHGLIGSEEWWAHIQSGDLLLHALEGVVSGFWPGPAGNGPAEFELRPPHGRPSRWRCEIEPTAAREAFRIGRSVVVQYVNQELKTAFRGSRETPATISISLG